MNLQQMRWRCHRGMRELDLFLLPFCDACYSSMTPALQETFAAMLQEEDPDIFSWCMGQVEPPAEYAFLIQSVQTFKRTHLPF